MGDERNPRAVVLRINRYSALRAAERALYPSVRLRREQTSAPIGTNLLVELRSLLGDGAAACEAALPALDLVDVRLRELAERLNEALESVSMAQFRATLPAITRENRAEATALLDFCIEDALLAEPRLPLAEYLATLLSSDGAPGRRVLTRDPVQASLRFAARCRSEQQSARSAASLDDSGAATLDLDHVSQQLRDAAFEVLSLEDLSPLVRRMRDLKREAGRALLSPDVLRSAVVYNLAVANRVEVVLEQERHADFEIRRTLEQLRALDAPRPVSVFASPGLAAWADALREMLSGEESESGPAAKLASEIDTSQLDDEELRVLADPHAPGAGELLRAALLVGMALRDLPSLRERLLQLDIDPESVNGPWVEELDRTLAAAIRDLAAKGATDDLARLTKARARLRG